MKRIRAPSRPTPGTTCVLPYASSQRVQQTMSACKASSEVARGTSSGTPATKGDASPAPCQQGAGDARRPVSFAVGATVRRPARRRGHGADLFAAIFHPR
ncbi:MAG: hypothetical protein HY561_04010 [Gemmatimonadetes bacterium]|nr:hypothetical protein [Gemmatimonadota bacterium]